MQESWDPRILTTLGGMREVREQRRYRRAKCGKVARCKAEQGESGMRTILRLNEMYRREVQCGYDH
jgi:hypothetical protein